MKINLRDIFIFLLFSAFCFVFSLNPCLANNRITNYISISSFANRSLKNLYYDFPLGYISFDGINFYVPSEPPNFLATSGFDYPYNLYPTIATFSANIQNPIEVYLLLNGGNTYTKFMNKTIGNIILNFTDGSSLKEDVIVGYNFRDWNIQDPSFAVATLDLSSNTKEVFRTEGANGEPLVVVDMMKISVPTSHINKTLESITLNDNSSETVGSLNPVIMLYGITVISEEIPVPSPTPILTPSPTPTPFYPVILIPGHGASFNREALLYNRNVPQSEWKMTPFVKAYDGIIKTFRDNLAYPGNKFYVFFYDWRKKIEDIADDLDNFLANKVAQENSDLSDFKVKIVGHSLGGLVARGYAQEYGIEKIDKLITVGSPHKGVIQAYKAWEGGEVGERNAWQWLALQLVLQINKRGFATNVETIRKIAPGTQDLLPIFDYLKEDSVLKPVSSMNQQNEWLKKIGVPGSDFFDIFTAIYGEKGNTPEFYKVENRSLIDQILGKWEDGKPVGAEFGDGDYTVLSKSAKFEEDPSEQLTLDHGELIEKSQGIEKILEKLEISYLSVSGAPATIYSPSLLFLLGSPVSMEIIDPDGKQFFSNEDKLIFIENALSGDYEIKITGEDGGKYRLIIGQLTENGDFWSEINGEVSEGKIDIYKINFNKDIPVENPLIDEKGNNYLEQAKERLEQVKNRCNNRFINLAIKEIQVAIKNVNRSRYSQALFYLYKGLTEIFLARKQLSDITCRNLSYEAIENLSLAYPPIFSKSGQKINKKTVQKLIPSTEKLLNKTRQKLNKAIKNGTVSQNQVISFTLAEENLKRAKTAFSQKDYPYSFILFKITNFLLAEVSI